MSSTHRQPPFIETLSWVQLFKQRKELHQSIIQRIQSDEVEKTQRKSSEGDNISVGTTTLEPINIFCMDGGGAKGYAMLVMVEVLEEMCIESSYGGDFVSRFDLVAGVSAGGVGSIVISQTKTTSEAAETTRKSLKHITTKVFPEFSYLRLVRTGSGFKDTNDVCSYGKMKYSEKSLIDNVSGLKCFALSTCRDESNKSIEPFLLRSYTHDPPPLNHSCHNNNNDENKCIKKDGNYYNGSSELKLCDAMAATSAVPGGFNRVKVNINGRSKSLADGGIFCNCPVAIALSEAKSLWPNRPIGVVLSFGLDLSENNLAQQSIDAVHLNHPGLHYHRVIVPEVHNFDFLETDQRKIAQMEKIVRDHMNNPTVHTGLSLVLDKLFVSSSRRKEEDEMQHDDKESNRIISEEQTDKHVLIDLGCQKEEDEMQHDKESNRIVLEEQTDKHVLIDLGCQKEEEIKDFEEKINESVPEEEGTSDVWVDNVNDSKKGISPFFCCFKKDWNFFNCRSRIMKNKYHKEKGGNTDRGESLDHAKYKKEIDPPIIIMKVKKDMDSIDECEETAQVTQIMTD